MNELERTIEVVSRDKVLIHRLLAEALESRARQDWLIEQASPEARVALLHEACAA